MNTNKTLQNLKHQEKLDQIGLTLIEVGSILGLISCNAMDNSDYFLYAVVCIWFSIAMVFSGWGFFYTNMCLMNRHLKELDTNIDRINENIKKMEQASKALDKLNLMLIREKTMLMLKGELDADQKQTMKRLRLRTFDMN